MPVQTTTNRGYLKIKDGCKVSVWASGDGAYTDLGETEGDVKLGVTWSEFQRQTGNAGIKAPIIRNMMVEGSFTLTDLWPSAFTKLSNGAITSVTTTATPDTTLDNQVIAANWTADTPIPLEVVDTTTGVAYNCTALTLTSVTGDSSGAGTAYSDYTLIADTNSSSGYSIILHTGGLATFATSEVITIVFASATPVASTTLYCGTSTLELVPYKLKFTHTDSSSVVDFEVELPVVYSQSGAFVLDFGGQGSDGVDSLPIQFKAQIDSTGTEGRQLFSYLIAG